MDYNLLDALELLEREKGVPADTILDALANGRIPASLGSDPVDSDLPLEIATVPALVRYKDTAGNTAKVPYPVEPGDPGTGRLLQIASKIQCQETPSGH